MTSINYAKISLSFDSLKERKVAEICILLRNALYLNVFADVHFDFIVVISMEADT